ncbi:MAG: membrane-associated Zn-dependent protease [Cenarchaeum symbiont of Oopsacas minuta]|nr:membrane-associated Zn-dependent protease [Cenarchaeum symbiont of Oopsacas minuta]
MKHIHYIRYLIVSAYSRPCIMEEWQIESANSIIKSAFEISNYAIAPKAVRYEIKGGNLRSDFPNIVRKLEENGMGASAELSNGRVAILVYEIKQNQSRWTSSSHIPRILFVIVVTLVMVDGYYRTENANNVVNIGDPLYNAALYTLALLGILGVHEMGHIVASRIHRVKTSWPYFLPGIPIYGIPTFGAFIRSRSHTPNRIVLFDIAIAGPIAGLCVAIIVSVYAAYEAPFIPDYVQEDIVLEDWGNGESILMRATLAAFDKDVSDVQILMTPLLFAAWVGFLLTFLNLLPAWQLDGGHMARTVFGTKMHTYATYASLGVLVLLGYWVMAMFIFVLSRRNEGIRPADDITKLDSKRKAAYVATLVLAALCAPIPAGIL